MKRYRFRLTLSSEEYLDYYRGTARSVLVHLANGSSIQFPASLLKQFVTSGGIQGDFVLTCDDNFKNPALRKLPDKQ